MRMAYCNYRGIYPSRKYLSIYGTHSIDRSAHVICTAMFIARALLTGYLGWVTGFVLGGMHLPNQGARSPRQMPVLGPLQVLHFNFHPLSCEC